MDDRDLGFTWHATASGEVHISRHGRGVVTVLRGTAAQRVLARLTGAHERTVQQVLARATGNYRRGNEPRR